MNHTPPVAIILGLSLSILCQTNAIAAQITITIIDAATDEVIPCRIHLKDSAGKPVKPLHLSFWRDHFVCRGVAELELSLGEYTYEIERGPEWSTAAGELTIDSNDHAAHVIQLKPLINMAQEGWWSGELHVHRPVDEIELLMRAEDLHVAPVITWWNRQSYWTNKAPPAIALTKFDGNRFYHVMGGEDERDGGALLYFNLSAPFDITAGQKFYPHSLVYAQAIRKTPGVWVDMEKPFWWDFPAWVAAGVGDSVGIANNHQHRSGMFENEAWGKPRDRDRLPNPFGNAWWTLEIYYHLLNSGFRIPPSAGSASGVLPNPIGYNRVYVQMDGELGWQKWWEGLRAGRCFVSNGPLLRCKANGHLPGHVFKDKEGKIQIELETAVTSRDPISKIEIIRNGEVFQVLDTSNRDLKTTIDFTESGWFLVRALADVPQTFRFASTGPFYVDNGPRRISRRSAKFFLDWVRERKTRITIEDPKRQMEVLQFYDNAEAFWEKQMAMANAE